jgi:ABC-2 type transport system ATP-binding protein
MNRDNLVIEMSKVSKSFGRTVALDHVDLDVHPGRIIGLLGANGAGKSTLLRTIIGLYLPDRGRVVTLGCPAKDLGPRELARIGYVHQEGELLNWMKVGQLVRYVSAYYPNWNQDLERRYIVDFEIHTGARVGSLSPGERQKVAILIAIGFEPELLILDEPASALDPIARAKFLDLLLDLFGIPSVGATPRGCPPDGQAQGPAPTGCTPNRTIIISSHILSDVEKVIDHVVIMDHGRIICDRNFDELREQYHRVRLTTLHGSLPANLPFAGVLDCQRNETEALLTVCGQTPQCLADQARAIDCEAEIQPLPLEDIYRLVVGEKREWSLTQR